MMIRLTEELLLRKVNKIQKLNILFRSVTKLDNNFEKLKDTHIFKKIWTKHELIEHLCKNVFYEDDYNIVLGKPYGVYSRLDRTKQIIFSESAACDCAVSDILPELKDRFKTEKLEILVNPERHFSGAILLSKGKTSDENLLKNFNKLTGQNQTYSFLTIVSGNPPETHEESFRIHCDLETKKYEIIEEVKKKKKKRQKKDQSEDKLQGTKVLYKHQVLSASRHCSLVKVDLNSNYLHCLRLVLATKFLCPVLGDFEYAPRVTTLFDVPLLVPPSDHLSNKKSLRAEVLDRLQLPAEDVDCCPCHVHLYSMMFQLKKKKFIVSVPPPDYFIFSCNRLGLEVKQFVRTFQYDIENIGNIE